MDIKTTISICLIICAACITLAACANTNPPEEIPSAAPAAPSSGETQAGEPSTDQSGFMWSMEVVSIEMAENLSTTKAAMQYGGNTVQVPYEENPGDGNTFMLIKMEIEKQKAGAGAFEWDKLYVRDEQGDRFYRHPNDTFLENHGFKRIKSTDLTIGKNEGFMCFEIGKQAAEGRLALIYDLPEGEIKIPLNQDGE